MLHCVTQLENVGSNAPGKLLVQARLFIKERCVTAAPSASGFLNVPILPRCCDVSLPLTAGESRDLLIQMLLRSEMRLSTIWTMFELGQFHLVNST